MDELSWSMRNSENCSMKIIKTIQNRIYEIRGERVMLDFDLAFLYEAETKVLNQAVKRNIKRFPEDFMFRLTAEEWRSMSSQIVTTPEPQAVLRSQFVTLKKGRGTHSKYLPYAFTEQGVAMLSGILRSEKAIAMNIAIMRAFVAIRKILIQENNMKEQLKQIKDKIGDHDAQLNQLYDAMENLLDEKVAQKKWEDRRRIGFKTK